MYGLVNLHQPIVLMPSDIDSPLKPYLKVDQNYLGYPIIMISNHLQKASKICTWIAIPDFARENDILVDLIREKKSEEYWKNVGLKYALALSSDELNKYFIEKENKNEVAI